MRKLPLLIASLLLLSACTSPSISPSQSSQISPSPSDISPNISPSGENSPIASPSVEPNITEPLSKTEALLGTVCTVTLYDAISQDTLDKAFERIAQIEKEISANDAGTEIDEINKNAGISPVAVSEDTVRLIQLGLEYSEKSNGSLDITIGPLVKLWSIGFDNARKPAQNEIDDTIKLINYKNVVVDESKSTVYLKEKGMAIDLGAVGKGFATDEVVRVLADNGVTSAIVDLGGNIFVMGSKKGNDWRVSVANPFDPEASLGVAHVQHCSMVTSGMYERFIEVDGIRYHHILNPKDGYPYSNNFAGVTVLSDVSAVGDAMSTTLFSKPLSEALAFVESMEGVEAIFITLDKTVYITDGLKDIFSISNADFRLISGDISATDESIPPEEQAYISSLLSSITKDTTKADALEILPQPDSETDTKLSWAVDIDGRQSRVGISFSISTGKAYEFVLDGGVGKFYFRTELK